MKHYPTISSMLENAWHKYEEIISKSRKNLSVENVHNLRVSTQRVEAILCLSKILTKNRKIKYLLKFLRATRSKLGALRDIQVEMQELEDLHFSSNDTKEYFRYCIKQKKIAELKALKAIEESTPKTLLKILSGEKVKVRSLEKKISHREIKRKLEENLRDYFFPLNKKLHNHSMEKKGGLHKYRILTKQLRYQGEAMKTLLGSTMLDISQLKASQTELGKIQDNNTMIKSLNSYLAKKRHQDQPGLIAIRDQIQLTHEKLVQLELQALSKHQWKNSA